MTNKFQDKKKVALPRYQQIAVAIAERIVENRYQVGQKIHARSTLASNFNVSPETARKAINVLVDLEIMDVRHGSGAYIASKEKAQAFVEQYQDVQSIQEIRQDILDSVERQQQELDNFSDLLNTLVQQTKKVHHMSPFVPFGKKYQRIECLAGNRGDDHRDPNNRRIVVVTGTLCEIQCRQYDLFCRE